MNQPQIIEGGSYSDHRGRIDFFNEFDLLPIRRMYQITHPDTIVFRGWQGHQIEQKWFQCIIGGFELWLVAPSDWQNPSGAEPLIHYILQANSARVLHVPGAWVTGIRAIAPSSTLVVFSDLEVAASKADDYRFPIDTWQIEA
jgi:hypothetical protein